MANEIVQAITNNLDKSLNAVSEALPKDFNKARFLQNTISVIKNNPKLQSYNQSEILIGSLQAAYLGLDFMGQEAWLVPYDGHVKFQLGYKGACKFVKKYSIRPLADLYAKVVRNGDEFEHGVDNGRPYIKWKPLPFNGGEMQGVFAVAIFKDGGILYEVMSKEEVDKIRKRSKASSSGPWVTDYEQMSLKVCLKRLTKNIETDFDNVDQRNAWESDNDEYTKVVDKDETVIDPFAENTVDIIDGTELVKTEDNAENIEDLPMPDVFGEVK